MLIAGIALIIGGVAIVGAGALGKAGRLSRQSIVGIRTKSTMASDEAWFAAHRAGAVWVMAGGVLMALGGVLTILAETEEAAGVVALITAGVGLVPIVIGGVRGNSAARSV